MAVFMRKGVLVRVSGRIEFDDRTGHTCRAQAKGSKGGWETAVATGDSLYEAREKAYDLATKKVVDKGNK
jgi:hypothetical protein